MIQLSTKYIKRIEHVEKTITIPADKSILHRAILLGSIVDDGTTKIYAEIGGEDNLATLYAMQKLGVNIIVENKKIFIKGCKKFNNNLLLNCQNSGTTMRMLSGLLSARNVYATLVGDASLMQRPMNRVSDLLVKMGANIQVVNGFAPITIQPTKNANGKVIGGNIDIKIASAQLKSAVLLAGLNAIEKTIIVQNVQTRDHSERMLLAFGADIQTRDMSIELQPSKLRAQNLQIPSDCSSAAFFLALGALKGKVTCKNISINATRSYYLDIMQRMGVALQVENKQMYGNEEVADVTAIQSNLKNIQIMSDEVPKIIDELPILAILMAYAKGKSEVFGAGELKVKESNRLQSIVNTICDMGGQARVIDDGFEVMGKGYLSGGITQSLHDHRIAMSAAIALACSQNGGGIKDAACVSISFKNFFDLLER